MPSRVVKAVPLAEVEEKYLEIMKIELDNFLISIIFKKNEEGQYSWNFDLSSLWLEFSRCGVYKLLSEIKSTVGDRKLELVESAKQLVESIVIIISKSDYSFQNRVLFPKEAFSNG